MASRKNRRVELLFLLLLLAVAGYVYLHPPFSTEPEEAAVATPQRIAPTPSAKSLPFDEETKEQIRRYFAGIEIDPTQNNLNYAIHLDHKVGRPQISQGKDKEAYRTFQKVLAISYGHGSLMGIHIGLSMLSNLIDRTGDRAGALQARMLAYKVTRAMNNREEYGMQELSIGRWIRDQEPGLAMLWLLRAKESLKRTRYEYDQIYLLVDLGHALRRLERGQEASEYYAKAWELAATLPKHGEVRRLKWEAGQAFAHDLQEHGLYEEAIAVLRETIDSFTEDEKNADYYMNTLHDLAKAYWRAGQKDASYIRYQSAYAAFELARASALGEQGRAKLDNNYRSLVNELVSFHNQKTQYTTALSLLETNKGRTLNDIMDDSGQQGAYREWNVLTRKQAEERRALIRAASDELVPVDSPTTAQLTKLFEKQEQERRKLQLSLQLRDVTVSTAFATGQLEKLSKQLPSNMAIVSLFVQDTTSVFLVTRGKVRFFPGKRRLKEYIRAVQELRLALSNPYTDFYRDPAQFLYTQVLAEAVHALPREVNTLVFSADDVFSWVPFAVLHDGRRFLGERFAVYRVPSLRFLKLDSSTYLRPAGGGVVCVDPEITGARLPFQKETGLRIGKLYQDRVTILSGPDCTVKKLVDAVGGRPQAGFLHIGAHGQFYAHDPMDSGIWIPETAQENQRWDARAMAAVDLSRVVLVTLSSCETGLTDAKRSRDVFGILRALSFAGAKAVIAPLWAVHDEATSIFMQRFYERYARGVPASIALQEVRRSLLRSGRFQHPFYWSGFVLTTIG